MLAFFTSSTEKETFGPNMQITEEELEQMIREVVPEVAQELLEQTTEDDELDVGDSVKIVGANRKGKIDEKIENRYWVSLEGQEDGQFFEPRHLEVIESKEQ